MLSQFTYFQHFAVPNTSEAPIRQERTDLEPRDLSRSGYSRVDVGP